MSSAAVGDARLQEEASENTDLEPIIPELKDEDLEDSSESFLSEHKTQSGDENANHSSTLVAPSSQCCCQVTTQDENVACITEQQTPTENSDRENNTVTPELSHLSEDSEKEAAGSSASKCGLSPAKCANITVDECHDQGNPDQLNLEETGKKEDNASLDMDEKEEEEEDYKENSNASKLNDENCDCNDMQDHQKDEVGFDLLVENQADVNDKKNNIENRKGGIMKKDSLEDENNANHSLCEMPDDEAATEEEKQNTPNEEHNDNQEEEEEEEEESPRRRSTTLRQQQLELLRQRQLLGDHTSSESGDIRLFRRKRDETSSPNINISRARELQSNLHIASQELVARLLKHLQKPNHTQNVIGLTLPASAVGWLSSQLYPSETNDFADSRVPGDGNISSNNNNNIKSNKDKSQGQRRHVRRKSSNKSQLSLLKLLLPRATHVRITSTEEWPPKVSSTTTSENTTNSAANRRSNRGSRETSDSNTSIRSDAALQQFLNDYWHWHYSPNIDLRLFPYCEALLLDQVPARLVSHWHAVQETLQVLRVERTCIYNNIGVANTIPLFHLYFLQSAENQNSHNIDIEIKAKDKKDEEDTDLIKTNHGDTSRLYEDYGESQFVDPLAVATKQSSKAPKKTGVQFEAVEYVNTSESLPLHFSGLTHVKFSNCCLGESIYPTLESSNQGSSSTTQLNEETVTHAIGSCIITPRLKSLSLCHNEILTEQTAMGGLSNLMFLSSLDLSHNSLLALPAAHYHLGNLQRLILSHNHISTTVGGIDRLAALEEIALDHNELPDLASVSGLARLPMLRKIRLKGNPLERNIWRSRRRRNRIHRDDVIPRSETTSGRGLSRRSRLMAIFRRNHGKQNSKRPQPAVAQKAYRVDVLNLFRERRLSELPTTATYRDLQQTLPVLDGVPPTLEELVALRARTFVPIVTEPLSMEYNAKIMIRHPANDDEDLPPSHSDLLSNSYFLRSKMRQNKLKAKNRKRRPVSINDGVDTLKLQIVSPGNVSENAWEVASEYNSGQTEQLPKPAFTVADVFKETSMHTSSRRRPEVEQRSSSSQLVLPSNGADQTFVTDDTWIEETDNLAIKYLEAAAVAEEMMAKPIKPEEVMMKPTSLPLSLTEKEILFIAESEKEERQSSKNQDSKNENGKNSVDATAAAPNDHELFDLSGESSTSKINATTESNGVSNIGESKEMESAASQVLSLPSTKTRDAKSPPVDQLKSVDSGKDLGTPSSHSSQTPVRLALRFPSQAWLHDDSPSRQSSMGQDDAGSNTMSINTTKMFQWAEDNSIYEGPRTYKDLKILDNLELYFRLFVFANASRESLAQSSLIKGGTNDLIETFQKYQQQYPRIQLWPVDRKIRENSTSMQQQNGQTEFLPALKRMDFGIGEDFRRVWKERVVACGKFALQRLTPNRTARYGFHGELLWSAAESSHLKPETVIEHRNSIICFSNRAFYIIQDHDSVTIKEGSPAKDSAKKRRKRFPLAVPKDARFESAKWPHALARHPFETLKAITIGFGFQRLTLCFSSGLPSPTVAGSKAPEKGDFTYVLLVSNKLHTVSILKDIQKLAADARETVLGSPNALVDDARMTIENDDRHVLDALGVAVAPEVIEVILHYQILQQRWNRGERGAVRRVCVVSDSKIFLLDEDYFGDGSDSVASGAITSSSSFASTSEFSSRSIAGETSYRLVDSASLRQISEVQAADADPGAITIVVKPMKKFQKSHNWRLLCRDGQGAERLVEDVRKAIAILS